MIFPAKPTYRRRPRPVFLLLAALLPVVLTGCHDGRAGLTPAAGSLPAPDTGGSVAHFSDVAQADGLNYRWVVAGKRPLNILQTIGNGCAFLDYNNDGNLDVLLVGPRLALYQGDGKGHFTDVTHSMGLDTMQGHFLGVAVGDYDNDGFDDLYISGYRTGLLLHNEQGHGFKDVTAQAGLALQPWGTSAAWADVDGSGRLSLYVGDYVDFGPNTQPQLCDNSGHQTACGPRFYQPRKGVLYRNLGGGRFADATAAWGAGTVSGKALGVGFADYKGTGRAGLAVSNDEMAGDLLLNSGKAFRNASAASGTAYDNAGSVHGGMGLDWGDYDNDGKMDLAVGTFQHEAKCLYHNDGSGLFSENSAQLGVAERAAPYVTFGTKWLDYDNDGWLDLVLADGHVQDNIAEIDKTETYREPTVLLHNEQGRQFSDVSALAGPDFSRPLVGRGLAVGDFDNDGRQDILVVDSEGAPLLLHNETPHAGHWLELTLVGVKSNRDGYGAVVTARAGGRQIVRLCHADGSYLSSSDKRVHLGLGAATQADLTIRWPSGHVDTLKGVAADRLLTLREGSPAAP